ncbi:hypothetical protein XAB3213_810004 [Xanthomonas citri pv. bilvae]|nr:hypothetical protein XAB3213_810004 [Xanthomonas citri pv. bilvae]
MMRADRRSTLGFAKPSPCVTVPLTERGPSEAKPRVVGTIARTGTVPSPNLSPRRQSG